MDRNKEKERKIDELIENAGTGTKIPVSPFFKDRVLDVLFTKEEVIPTANGWFTLQLQLWTLGLILCMNVLGFYQITKMNYDEQLDQFAASYQWVEEEPLSNLK
ncbi:MAG: hypothetical protein AAFP76_10630 [Bacteroidota bacterium]